MQTESITTAVNHSFVSNEKAAMVSKEQCFHFWKWGM